MHNLEADGLQQQKTTAGSAHDSTGKYGYNLHKLTKIGQQTSKNKKNVAWSDESRFLL